MDEGKSSKKNFVHLGAEDFSARNGKIRKKNSRYGWFLALPQTLSKSVTASKAKQSSCQRGDCFAACGGSQ